MSGVILDQSGGSELGAVREEIRPVRSDTDRFEAGSDRFLTGFFIPDLFLASV